MSDNNKTWAAFWSENKPLVWFIAILLTFLLGYLIYNKWAIEVGGTKLTPPVETKEEEADLSKEAKVPKKTTQKHEKTNSTPKKQTMTSDDNKSDERQGLSISGNIVQENGEPVIDAKVICSNCLTSNSPVFSDQTGGFKINYSIECKESEYPTKAIKLTIFHQKKTYFASQSISQNFLTVELK